MPTHVNLRVPKLFHDPIHNFGVHQRVSIHRLHIREAVNLKNVFLCNLHFDLYGVINVDQNGLQVVLDVIDQSNYSELNNGVLLLSPC